jgi:kynurenine formamidase
MAFIDLSLTIEQGMPVYPGDMHTSVKRLEEPAITEAGWVAHSIAMSLHAGTHVESPAHSIPGGKTLGAYSLETFCGEVTTIAREEIGHHEVRTPILLVYSGYDQWWGEEKYFSPPALTVEQAAWIGKSGVKILGNDTISVGDINIHQAIQGRGILIIESMCNLKQLLHKRAKLYLFPLKIDKEASPVRAVAEIF